MKDRDGESKRACKLTQRDAVRGLVLTLFVATGLSACGGNVAGRAPRCEASPGAPGDEPLSGVASPPVSLVVPALTIDLPKATEWTTGVKVVSVELTEDGRTFLNGQSLDDGKVGEDAVLLEHFLKASVIDPEVRAVIRADQKVRYGRVIHMMDLLKQGGIEKVAFAVTPVGNGSRAKAVPARGSSPVGLTDPTRSCAFPPAADTERVDNASVLLVVAVDAMGGARWVRVLDDPGYGFGKAASDCALSWKYSPELDVNGAPIPALSPHIRVKFVR